MGIQDITLLEQKKQSQNLELISKQNSEIIETLKELVSVSKETLNFFVAVEERESGVESSFNQEYLTEIKKNKGDLLEG